MPLHEESNNESPRTAQPPPPPEFSLEKGSKIIKNGNLSFEVTKLENAKSEIDALLKSFRGYYENELYNSLGSSISYSLKIRVPIAKFDSLVIELEDGVGELKSKHINAKDVTEEYVDLKIRLENNLAYLKQYQVILKKAKSIKEVLEVQDKTRRIEEEIESKKGQLKYLDDKVKFSTLNLEISELIVSQIANKPNHGIRVVNAFNNGIQGFLEFFVIAVNLWPFILIIGLLIWGRKPIWSWIKRRNNPLDNM